MIGSELLISMTVLQIPCPFPPEGKSLNFKKRTLSGMKHRHMCFRETRQAKELVLSFEDLDCEWRLRTLHREGKGLEWGMKEGLDLAWGRRRIRAFQAGSSVRAKVPSSAVSMHILSIHTV